MHDEKNKIICYKAIIAYDGTGYKGWQSQREGCGIADSIKSSLENFFRIPIAILGASRTDAGVHAYGQVALMKLPAWRNPNRLCKLINDHIPADIHFRLLEECSDKFNPKSKVVAKTYRYTICFNRPLPWARNFVCYYPYPCDYQIFEQVLHYFVGTHDFKSLITHCEDKNTIRTIDECSLEWLTPATAHITVVGQGFLHHMIRRMIGAALTLASRRESPKKILDILAECNPRQCLLNASPKGLMLMHIQYEGESAWNRTFLSL